jgi:RNA polymerase sigma-70 factor, ECF subfamily
VHRPSADEHEERLLRAYVRAWEDGDGAALAAVLHEDAVLRMPPIPTWYHGRTDIQRFFSIMAKTMGSRRLVPTVANGAPALALYVAGDDGILRGHSLHVLELQGGTIVAVDAFLDATALERFDLPEALVAL